MSIFLKLSGLIVLLGASTATGAVELPTIGSLVENHCAGGTVAAASFLGDTEVIKKTVHCPNGFSGTLGNMTTQIQPRSRIQERQNQECGQPCTPTTCFGAPDPTPLDCDNLILLLQNNPGTFLAAAATTTSYELGTCECAFLAAIDEFECNASMATACRSIMSACSQGPGDCLGPAAGEVFYGINLSFN